MLCALVLRVFALPPFCLFSARDQLESVPDNRQQTTAQWPNLRTTKTTSFLTTMRKTMTLLWTKTRTSILVPTTCSRCAPLNSRTTHAIRRCVGFACRPASSQKESEESSCQEKEDQDNKIYHESTIDPEGTCLLFIAGLSCRPRR